MTAKKRGPKPYPKAQKRVLHFDFKINAAESRVLKKAFSGAEGKAIARQLLLDHARS